MYRIILICLLLCSCGRYPEERVTTYPPVSPAYFNVIIPCNIAPLNFRINGECSKTEVVLSGRKSSVRVVSGYKAEFPEAGWKKLLKEQVNDSIRVEVKVLANDKWSIYKPFYYYVSVDSIDGFLSYRLIEPGYEVWNKLQLAERELGSFKERVIADNNLLDGGCINCHTYSSQNPKVSFFHLRRKNGGTMIQKNGVFRKLNTATDSTISAGVYGSWHPSGRYIAFSTNVIIPEFHSRNDLRIEVYDTVSDVVVADLEKNEILKYHLLSGKKYFETFPSFSADGKKLYFCSAKATRMPEGYRSVKYSLCSVDFDAAERKFGTVVDTLVSSHKTGKTLSEPKASPDGKYILFTSFDYGNFPVWHREADLHLLDLHTMNIDSLPEVNSDHADSYHSWSSNSRWIVFASKRDNGMYGKIYISHVSPDGKCSAPFLLPQKDPDHYDLFLKSYNIPELSRGPVPIDPVAVEKSFRHLEPEQMTPVIW